MFALPVSEGKETPYKSKTIRKTFRIPLPLQLQILTIAKEEKNDETFIFLSLVYRGLKQYIHKKGIFYCQECKNQESNKKMHVIPVGFEEFVFCDDCFFSEKYKIFIKQRI